MMIKYQGMCCVALGMLLLMAVGCAKKSKKPDGLPDLHPLSVKLVYDDGTPVEEASIQLSNTDKSLTQRWVSGGKTDNQGNAIIRTHGEFPGAPTGNFKVIVNKEEVITDDSSYPPRITARYNHVEKQYTTVQNTPLIVDVKPDTKSVELKVGKKVREAIAGPPG